MDWADKLFPADLFIGAFAFAVSGETFYVEYMRQLFRWKRGESKWFNTGLVDTDKSADEK